MKDEFQEKIISEFVGLKSKIYSLIAVDGEDIKKGKGVNKNIVKSIRHKKYVDALFKKNNETYHEKNSLHKLHKIGTYIWKISSPCFDDERYIIDDGINSLAYFHRDVKSPWEM